MLLLALVVVQCTCHVLSLSDVQVRFATNVTFWHEKKPAIYHGHLAYIDFSRCVLVCAGAHYVDVTDDVLTDVTDVQERQAVTSAYLHLAPAAADIVMVSHADVGVYYMYMCVSYT